MTQKDRCDEILNILKSKKRASVAELSNTIQVPLTTLRRDLNYLQAEGLIKKFHGGAEYVDSSKLVSDIYLRKRLIINVAEKMSIAKIAKKYIKPETVIFIESSACTYYLISDLSHYADSITVLTNSPLHAQELVKKGVNKVYLLGGRYKPIIGATIGPESLKLLQGYDLDIAFLGVNGIKNNSLYTTDDEEANLKSAIIKKATTSYVLAEKYKYKQKSFVKFADSRQVVIIHV